MAKKQTKNRIRELRQQKHLTLQELGDKLGKPVVGTCDVHFLNPDDEIYRRIIMAGQWRYTRGKAEPAKKYGISPLTFPLMGGVK